MDQVPKTVQLAALFGENEPLSVRLPEAGLRGVVHPYPVVVSH